MPNEAPIVAYDPAEHQDCAAIIVWSSKEGVLHVQHRNGDHLSYLGMLEIAKSYVLQDIPCAP